MQLQVHDMKELTNQTTTPTISFTPTADSSTDSTDQDDTASTTDQQSGDTDGGSDT